MAIPVACQCGKRFSAKERLAGKRVKCPNCANVLEIPILHPKARSPAQQQSAAPVTQKPATPVPKQADPAPDPQPQVLFPAPQQQPSNSNPATVSPDLQQQTTVPVLQPRQQNPTPQQQPSTPKFEGVLFPQPSTPRSSATSQFVEASQSKDTPQVNQASLTEQRPVQQVPVGSTVSAATTESESEQPKESTAAKSGISVGMVIGLSAGCTTVLVGVIGIGIMAYIVMTVGTEPQKNVNMPVGQVAQQTPGTNLRSQQTRFNGWGELIDPSQDCVVSESGGKLTIRVPIGPHDFWQERCNYNAPRVVQHVEGDFVVQVKVTSNWEGVAGSIPQCYEIFAGLIVYESEKHYLRHERNQYMNQGRTRTCMPPIYDNNNVRHTKWKEYQDGRPFVGQSTWLRIVRNDKTFTTSISHNGEDWSETGKIATVFPSKVRVGVVAVCNSGEESVFEFEDYSLMTLQEYEDKNGPVEPVVVAKRPEPPSTNQPPMNRISAKPPARPARPRAELDIPQVLDWHSNGKNLRGTRPVPNEDLAFYHFSWMCDLLPHIGYEHHYNNIDFNKPWMQQSSATTMQISQFLDPTDERRTVQVAGGLFGTTHFVGMSGVEERRNDVAAHFPRSDPRAGVFGYNEIARPTQITDGISQTILIIGAGDFIGPWVQGGGATVRGAREPYFDQTISYFGSRGARRGALSVMADGSVRVISADTDPSVFKSLCTINGSDSVDKETLGKAFDNFLQAIREN